MVYSSEIEQKLYFYLNKITILIINKALFSYKDIT
jgi:hypothetical protein